MLRVVLLGSYKKPREVTWMTGVVLLLIILGFALTGYLLPWDQKAYWATTVTIRVTREDGYSQAVDRQVVFLVKTSDTEVMALSSTCTHLGCRVSWNADDQVLKCPCHGGVFDRTGAVKSGPPPAPLARLGTRLEGDQIMVEI
jgi:Rieske Fe-S protein